MFWNLIIFSEMIDDVDHLFPKQQMTHFYEISSTNVPLPLNLLYLMIYLIVVWIRYLGLNISYLVNGDKSAASV